MITAASIVCLLPVKAEAKTIIVPDDYKSIQEAIDHATDGDTVSIKEGTYNGPRNKTLIINKSIHLVGDAENTIINLDPPLVPMAIFTYQYMDYTNPIKVQADGVTLSGLTLNTPGGVISVEGNYVEFKNNSINTALWVNSTYVKIVNNFLNSTSYGVMLYGSHHEVTNNALNGVQSQASYTIISSNKIAGTAVDGLVRIDGSSNIIYGNEIKSDGWPGIQLGRSNVNGTIIAENNITGTGILLESASNSVVSGNRIEDGGGISLTMGQNNVFSMNHLENNTIGILLGDDQTDIARKYGPSASNNTVFHNNFIDNKQQGLDWNWLGTNQWDKDGEGNYWSDYNGIDWTFDGIGDSPYMIEEAKSFYAEATQSQDNHPLMHPYDINKIDVQLPEWAEYSQAPSKNKGDESFPVAPVAIATLMSIALIAVFVYRAKARK
jgi:parallel beta-helix repeat protein